MLTAETKRRIDDCRAILVGKLPLPTDQVELITLALIYKFMDDLDEESVQLGGKRSFFTGGLERYRWRSLLPQTVSADTRLTLFADGIEALGSNNKSAHLPALFRDIFRNTFLKFRDGRILTLFLNEVNGFAYSHSEELGNAFEYLLQCMGTQGENGQFRTPRHIIDFIVACLDPKPGETILDPACGTGGFLVSAYKHILSKHTSPQSSIPGDRLTHAQRQKVYGSVTGYDITDLMVKLSKVNLFLHGFPDPGIHIYDTLSNDARWNEKADLILANPPFMTPKGGVTPHSKFRIPATKAEVLFTDYIAEHLNTDGRGGVIVPNGITATTQNAYVKLRRFLVEDSLVAVISLPSGVFKPYSGVKTSILLLDKKLARQRKEVLFLKITADGFDLGDKRTPIEADDLPEAERVVKLWLAGNLNESAETPLAWKAVKKQELIENPAVNLQAEPLVGIGAVTGEVETVRLGDVCVKCQQVAPASLGRPTFQYIDIDSVDNVGFRIAEPKSISVGEAPSRARKLVKVRDVLFSTVRPYLKNIAIVPPSLDGEIASTGFGVMRADESRAVPEFLFAVVSNQRFVDAANDLTTGASYPAITENQLFGLKIPLPPLEEQQRIVEEIECYQKVLDGARQILASYSPRFACKPEWPRVQLADVVTVTSGGTPSKANKAYWTGSIPWISAKDMKQPRLSDAVMHVSDIAVAETAADLAPIGTVLVLVRGMGLANGVPICELTAPCAFNQDIKALHVKDGLVPGFLAAALRQETMQLKGVITTAAHGTLKIETDRLLSITIPFPDVQVQKRVIADLDAEADQIESVRSMAAGFEAKIESVLDRLWSSGESK